MARSLIALRLLVEHERVQRGPGCLVGRGPVPEPDGVLPQIRSRTTRCRGRRVADGLVVGVTVSTPGRDDHGPAPVPDGLDELGGEGLLRAVHRAVLQLESQDTVRAEHVSGVPGLLGPDPAQLLGRVRRRVGVAVLAVSDADDVDRTAEPDGTRDQPARAESLVVGVRSHHDQAADALERERLTLTPVRVAAPHLGRCARTHLGEVPRLLAAHHRDHSSFLLGHLSSSQE